jgi:hypothetical protein
MLTREYLRPYTLLATHIKSHAIDPSEFIALLPKVYTCQVVTQYYDQSRRYVVNDGPGGREYTYEELLKQTETELSPALERVTEYYQILPVAEFVNHGTHQHVRQKILLIGENRDIQLEILLLRVRTYGEVQKSTAELLAALRESKVPPADIVSLSYRQYGT